MRRPLQGTWNIIRFNWPLYLLSAGMLLVLLVLAQQPSEGMQRGAYFLFLLITSTTLLSLLVSCYVYDLSGLYKLNWLNGLTTEEKAAIVNIHAGFDETSALLKARFKSAEMTVLDFYDPARHTEASIRRARKAYPSYPDTRQVSTGAIPLDDNSIDYVFVIFAAHEVRNEEERIAFFKELNRIVKPSGQIVVTEHLRDMVNFMAYNIGFFHFHAKASWCKTFSSSGLRIREEFKVTPFVSTFMLVKNGASS